MDSRVPAQDRARLSQLLSRSFDSAEHAAAAICGFLRSALDADLVYAARMCGDELVVLASDDGLDSGMPAGRRLPLAETFCGRALLGVGPQAAADLGAGPYADVPSREPLGSTSFAMAPVRGADGRATGSVGVLHRAVRPSSEEELALLELLGGILAREHELDRVRAREVALAAELARADSRYRTLVDDLCDVIAGSRHLPGIGGCTSARRIRAATSPGRRPPPAADVPDRTGADRAAAGTDQLLPGPVDLEGIAAAVTRAARPLSGGAPAADEVGSPDGRAVPSALRGILARADGDPATAAELVAAYLTELPGRRLRIQASLRRGESRVVLAAAESLRTASELVGASAVSAVCAALGAAAADEDLDAAWAFLPSLLLHCRRFAADLHPFAEADAVRAAVGAAAG